MKKDIYMFSVNNILRSKHNAPPYAPSFKGDMNAVRYVIVDGNVTDDKKVVEDVTKQLVKSLKNSTVDNLELRKSVKQTIPEYYWTNGFQATKFLKLNLIGREFNIILGESAAKLKHIWEQAGVSLADKKKQAGDVVRKLIYDKTSKHIAIEAITENVKGKIKYIAKRVFITI